MDTASLVLQILAAIPVAAGATFLLLGVVACRLFMRRPPGRLRAQQCVPVTLLKPVCGLEKRLAQNLRSCCEQDHPDFQVIFSVQHKEDAALPLLYEFQEEFGDARVSIVIASHPPMPNGKIHNLVGAMQAVRNDVLVLSDSDISLPRDYLRMITAPLSDREVGFVCTPYKGVHADTWYEKIELLSLHDYTNQVVFAWMTGASGFLLGGSVAFRREDLEKIEGFEPLQDYLVEDYEMGQRLAGLGLRPVLLPTLVDTVIDLSSPSTWWGHMVYWDQNTWAARPIGFLATILIRPVPFAIFFLVLRGFDPIGWAVLSGSIATRLLATASTMRSLGDREGLRNLGWLVLRDLAGLVSWAAALRNRDLTWRGLHFDLTSEGRLVPRDLAASAVGTTLIASAPETPRESDSPSA